MGNTSAGDHGLDHQRCGLDDKRTSCQQYPAGMASVKPELTGQSERYFLSVEQENEVGTETEQAEVVKPKCKWSIYE